MKTLTVLIAVVFTLTSCLNSTKKKSNSDGSHPITFGICTDVHHNVIHDGVKRMQIFVDDMNNKKADFIIQMGDFCYPDSTSDEFFELFENFEGGRYSVLGNHDRDNGVNWEQTMEYFGMPAPYYSFNKNGFHFIVLNGNEKIEGSQKGYPRYISKKQLNWLSNDLNKTDSKTVVFVHQSLFDTHGVINQDTVRNILANKYTKSGEKKVIVCFSGHSHVDAAERIDSVWYVAINSMSYHWVGEDFKHETYSTEIHEKYPWIEYVCPYKDPLYAFVTIDKNGTVTIKGENSDWEGISPDSLGFVSDYYKPEWIVPKVSDRVLRQK